MRTLLFIAITALAACGGSKKSSTTPADPNMTPAESTPMEEKSDDAAAPEGEGDKATADPCEGGE